MPVKEILVRHEYNQQVWFSTKAATKAETSLPHFRRQAIDREADRRGKDEQVGS